MIGLLGVPVPAMDNAVKFNVSVNVVPLVVIKLPLSSVTVAEPMPR